MATSTLLPALALAVGAGIGTFFSPCAYPLLPGYVAFYTSQREAETVTLGSTLVHGLVAGAGTVLGVGLIAGVVFVIGDRTLSSLAVLEPLVGVALIVFGLLLVTGRNLSLGVRLPKRRAGLPGLFLFGGGYAVAAIGCVAPIFFTVIATALAISTTGGLLVVGTYAAVVAGLMLSVTVATGMGLLAGGRRFSAHTGRIKQVAGIVIILAGIGQLYVVLAYSATGIS